MTQGNEEAAIIVLFGATGDLAKRKLFPALYSLYREGQLADNFVVVGSGRRQLTKNEFYEHIKKSLDEFSRYSVTEEDWEEFISHFYYTSLEIKDTNDYEELLTLISSLEVQYEIPGNRLFYLAIAPELFETVVYNLHKMELSKTEGWRRLIIEKPFGQDLKSAQELNEKSSKYLKKKKYIELITI